MTLRKWILLAEDSDFDAELAMRALTDEGHPCDVRVAKDGQEALDCLYRRGEYETRSDGHPALLLLDLKMPRVDGKEVLRQVKGDAQLRNIPVVVFTSSREEADLVSCYELGANAYVVKPLDFKQFTSVVQAIRAFWVRANEVPNPSARTQSSGAIAPKESAAVRESPRLSASPMIQPQAA